MARPQPFDLIWGSWFGRTVPCSVQKNPRFPFEHGPLIVLCSYVRVHVRLDGVRVQRYVRCSGHCSTIPSAARDFLHQRRVPAAGAGGPHSTAQGKGSRAPSFPPLHPSARPHQPCAHKWSACGYAERGGGTAICGRGGGMEMEVAFGRRRQPRSLLTAPTVGYSRSACSDSSKTHPHFRMKSIYIRVRNYCKVLMLLFPPGSMPRHHAPCRDNLMVGSTIAPNPSLAPGCHR